MKSVLIEVSIGIPGFIIMWVLLQEELLASQHYDDNSVACIEDKCHVLGIRQYCRSVGLKDTLPV